MITPSLDNYYKTSHYLLQVGTHGFEGVSLLWPSLPGKNKALLFYFTQILSLRFCLALMYREAELSASALAAPSACNPGDTWCMSGRCRWEKDG